MSTVTIDPSTRNVLRHTVQSRVLSTVQVLLETLHNVPRVNATSAGCPWQTQSHVRRDVDESERAAVDLFSSAPRRIHRGDVNLDPVRDVLVWSDAFHIKNLTFLHRFPSFDVILVQPDEVCWHLYCQ